VAFILVDFLVVTFLLEVMKKGQRMTTCNFGGLYTTYTVGGILFLAIKVLFKMKHLLLNIKNQFPF
jgi:hypothetical protein